MGKIADWKTKKYDRLYREYRGQGMTVAYSHAKAVRDSKGPVKLRVKKIKPHSLLNSVAKWIEANGGKVFVIGGVEIQKWPGDSEFTFRVAIKCTGRQPKHVEEIS